MPRLVVSITCAGDAPDRATVGFEVAQASAAGGVETVVFLSTEGAWLAQQGVAETIPAAGGRPLAEVLVGFTAAGGTILVCGSCFRRRGLTEARLVPRARVVGGATLVEFLYHGAACLTY